MYNDIFTKLLKPMFITIGMDQKTTMALTIIGAACRRGWVPLRALRVRAAMAHPHAHEGVGRRHGIQQGTGFVLLLSISMQNSD